MSTQWQAARPGRPGRPRRPPLSKRLRPGHWMALDFLVAVPCALVLFLSLDRTLSWPFQPLPVAYQLTSVVLALGLSIPLGLRRKGPLAALVTVTAFWLLTALIAVVSPDGLSQGAALDRSPGFLVPAAYVIYLVAASYQRRTAVAALAVLIALLAADGVAVQMAGGGGSPGAVFVALIVIIFWVAGYAAGQRRAYAGQLQEQAASGAVTEERLRIARELHDVVAHSMTVVAVQAGYGLHVIEGQPAKAQEALGAIQATSREALADMRRMLGVLRHGGSAPFSIKNGADGHRDSPAQPPQSSAVSTDNGAAGGQGAGIGGLRFAAAANGGGSGDVVGSTGGAAPLAPAPGLGDLDRLVARVAHAGVQVDLRVHGECRGLPPGIDLAAFRIVQEALTNVVKHAGVAACRVTVGYEEDELSVEITDEGQGGRVPAAAGGQAAGPREDGGGHGLIGMRERVSMYGGELTAGPRPERGFRVAARLPVADETS